MTFSMFLTFSFFLVEKDDRRKARAGNSDDDDYVPDEDPTPQSGRKRRHGNSNDTGNQHDGKSICFYLFCPFDLSVVNCWFWDVIKIYFHNEYLFINFRICAKDKAS